RQPKSSPLAAGCRFERIAQRRHKQPLGSGSIGHPVGSLPILFSFGGWYGLVTVRRDTGNLLAAGPVIPFIADNAVLCRRTASGDRSVARSRDGIGIGVVAILKP